MLFVDSIPPPSYNQVVNENNAAEIEEQQGIGTI